MCVRSRMFTHTSVKSTEGQGRAGPRPHVLAAGGAAPAPLLRAVGRRPSSACPCRSRGGPSPPAPGPGEGYKVGLVEKIFFF